MKNVKKYTITSIDPTLLLACQQNNLADFQAQLKILRRNPDFNLNNSIDSNLNTILHIACDLGHTDMITFLYKDQVDITIKNKHNETPGYIIAKKHFKLVPFIARLQKIQLFLRACIDKNATQIEESLKETPDLIKEKDNDHLSPLFMVVASESKTNQTTAIKTLLKYKADPNELILGMTALYYAAQFGYEEIAEILLEHNANPNLYSDGTPPLYIAIQQNHTGTAKILIAAKGIDINLVDKTTQSTPLHIAILINNIEIVKLLVEKNADQTKTNARSLTPLDLAIESRALEIVTILLDPFINSTNYSKQKQSILERAKKTQNQTLIDLIERKHLIKSLIDLCKDEKKKEKVQQILKLHPHIIDERIGDTFPAYFACANNNYQILQILLDNGANPNMKWGNDTTLLMLACSKGHVEIVQLLLRNNQKTVEIDSINSNQSTALHIACKTRTNANQIVMMLLLANAKIDVLDKNGMTPISQAVKHKNIEAINILIKYYPDSQNIRNKNGTTALDIAREEKNEEIIKLLTSSNKFNEMEEFNLDSLEVKNSIALVNNDSIESITLTKPIINTQPDKIAPDTTEAQLNDSKENQKNVSSNTKIIDTPIEKQTEVENSIAIVSNDSIESINLTKPITNTQSDKIEPDLTESPLNGAEENQKDVLSNFNAIDAPVENQSEGNSANKQPIIETQPELTTNTSKKKSKKNKTINSKPIVIEIKSIPKSPPSKPNPILIETNKNTKKPSKNKIETIATIHWRQEPDLKNKTQLFFSTAPTAEMIEKFIINTKNISADVLSPHLVQLDEAKKYQLLNQINNPPINERVIKILNQCQFFNASIVFKAIYNNYFQILKILVGNQFNFEIKNSDGLGLIQFGLSLKPPAIEIVKLLIDKANKIDLEEKTSIIKYLQISPDNDLFKAILPSLALDDLIYLLDITHLKSNENSFFNYQKLSQKIVSQLTTILIDNLEAVVKNLSIKDLKFERKLSLVNLALKNKPALKLILNSFNEEERKDLLIHAYNQNNSTLLRNILDADHSLFNIKLDRDYNLITHWLAKEEKHAQLLFDLLKENKIDFNLQKNRDENTPLHLAVDHHCLKNLRLLLGSRQINPFVKNIEGETPAHLSAKQEKTDTLAIILELKKPTEVLTQHNLVKNNIIHTMIIYKNEDQVRLISTLQPDWLDKNIDGNTALHAAVVYGNPKIFGIILAQLTPEQINTCNRFDQTALHFAVEKRNWIFADLLLSKGADPLIADRSKAKQTPQDIANQLGFTIENRRIVKIKADRDPVLANSVFHNSREQNAPLKRTYSETNFSNT